MLAQLLRAGTLGLLLASTAWAAWFWRVGHPVLAVMGAVGIASVHAWVLALEFVLLQRVHRMHRDDPAPRATPPQLLRAWWGEIGSAPAVFCWRQPFRSRRWPDRLPADASGRRGVLLVHGFVCNRGIWNPWLARLTTAGVPFVAVDLEPVFGSIDDYVAVIDRAVQRLERATGLPPVAVAHSMGGLALRNWWAGTGCDARLHHAVTIASPHRGTWLARFAMTHNARQLQHSSAWLQALDGREPLNRAAGITCFYGHCDNIVFPPKCATLDGADNRHLAGVAHVHMLARPEPWQELQEWLRGA